MYRELGVCYSVEVLYWQSSYKSQETYTKHRLGRGALTTLYEGEAILVLDGRL
jgi:hypothetical protein